jgi:hypothetical protein
MNYFAGGGFCLLRIYCSDRAGEYQSSLMIIDIIRRLLLCLL